MTDAMESWAEIQDDPDAIIACGERWKAVAAKIGCQLHGFNDGRSASFFTPDGNVIEIGPKFRAALASDVVGELREALEGVLSALSPLNVAGKGICALDATLSRRVTEAVQLLAKLQPEGEGR